jgi:O-antigen/teichoic acid export membrane protein
VIKKIFFSQEKKNILYSILVFCINILISFFLTPFIVKKLGEESYGFIGLSNNFISYIAIFLLVFNSMYARFISLNYHNNDYKNSNLYLNSVLRIVIFLSVLIAFFSFLFLPNIDVFLNIPLNLKQDVTLLLFFLVIGFMLNSLSSVFSVSTYLTNRLDLSNLRNLQGIFLRSLIILFSFSFFDARLYFIGIASFCSSLLILFTNYKYLKVLTPELNINFKFFDLQKIKILVSSGVWNLVLRTGTILLEGLDLIIANIFLGPKPMGILALSKIIPNVLSSFTITISGNFMPNLNKLFSQKDNNGLKFELLKSFKKISLIIVPCLGVFISFGEEFYKLWLNSNNFTDIYYLSVLTLLSLIFSVSINSIFGLFTVLNKVRYNAILILISGSISTLLVYILLNFDVIETEYGLFFIAGISSFITIFRNLFFTIPYLSQKINLRLSFFYLPIFKCLICVLIIFLFSFLLKYFFNFNNWVNLFCGVIISLSIGFVSCFLIIFGFNHLLKKTSYLYKYYILRLILSKRLKKLKNSYENESCFIIGNGPSLNVNDLNLIKDEYSFATNRIFNLFDSCEWRPTFYCIQDSLLINEISQKLSTTKLGVKNNFYALNSWKDYSKIIKKDPTNFFFYLDTIIRNEYPQFSSDISNHIHEGRSITISVLQIAFYLGFKKIYLLGVDHTSSVKIINDKISYDSKIIDYFDGINNHGITKRPYYESFTEKAFILAKKIAEDKGIEIVNVTRGGKLEVFKRSSLETVINNYK